MTSRSIDRPGWWLVLMGAGLACHQSDPSSVIPPPAGPPEPATLTLRVETSGTDYDPDGYLVSVNGAAPVRVSANGSISLGRVLPGSYSATLSDVARWCGRAPESPAKVEVAPVGDFNLRVLVRCETTFRDVVFYAQHGKIRYVDLAGPGSNPDRLPFKEISCAPDNCGQPSVSPDGRVLAYASGNSTYLFMRAGATAPYRIIGSAVAHQAPVSWAPDGDRIVFPGRPAGASQQTELFVRRVSAGNGSGGQQITTGSEHVLHPDWSPDGEWIIFSRNVTGQPRGRLWRVKPDGTGLQPFDDVVTGHHAAEWFPDGEWVIYAGIDGMRMTRVDGTDSVLLPALWSLTVPDISPDGSSVVAIKLHGNCLYTLVRVFLPAGPTVPLGADESACNGGNPPNSPAWGK